MCPFVVPGFSRSLRLYTVTCVILAPLASPLVDTSDYHPLDEADLPGSIQDWCGDDEVLGLVQTASQLSLAHQSASHLVSNQTTKDMHRLDAMHRGTHSWGMRQVLYLFDGSGADKQCLNDGDCGWHSQCNTHTFKCETMALGQNIVLDIAMCALAFVIAGFALAAGVGGGGLYVPLLMIVLAFDVRIASALSQAMLFGGALAAFAYNANGSHPMKPERPLISFELAGVMGTGLMGGAQVGSVLHALAPSALTLVLLIIVLLDSARKSLRLALKKSREETEASKIEISQSAHGSHDANAEEILKRSSTAKWQLFFIWLLCLVVIVIKGLFLRMCSWGWWILTIAASVCLSGMSLYFGRKLGSQEPLDSYDIDFKSHAMTISWMSVLAGALAALCGIGGGMVMGPLLVEMHVPPPVSSATTATTLVVLSSSTLLVYICRGVAPAGYSVLLSVFTMSGALAGKFLVGWWVQKTGKQSLIVWALVAVIVLSTILMGIQGVMTIIQNPSVAVSFRDFCPGHVTPTMPVTD